MVVETVEIDYREHDEDKLVQRLILREEVEDIEPGVDLPVADIRIGDALFERKRTISDYASSMLDGRLKSQVKRMVETTDDAYVIVNEPYTAVNNVPNSDVNPQSLKGFRASLMARFNVPVIFEPDYDLFIDLIVDISRKANDDSKEVVIHPSSTFRDVDDQLVRMLTSIPEIGLNTSENISEHYSTPMELLAATPGDLQRIDGIGEATESKVLTAMGKEVDYE